MMRVVKLLRLSRMDRELVIQAGFLLVAMRIGLLLLPFRTVQGMAARAAGKGRARRSNAPATPERIEWAMRAAARYVPGASCLHQALAAQVLMARHGHAARLRIGVARTAGHGVAGHAWVETDTGVVLGGGDLSCYAPLPALEGEPAAPGGAQR
jgi:hypothetical protein